MLKRFRKKSSTVAGTAGSRSENIALKAALTELSEARHDLAEQTLKTQAFEGAVKAAHEFMAAMRLLNVEGDHVYSIEVRSNDPFEIEAIRQKIWDLQINLYGGERQESFIKLPGTLH